MKYLISLILLLTVPFYSNAQESTDSTPFVCVFSPQPEFPGGMDSLYTFINKHFQWNQGQLTVGGKVYVQFIVNEDGSVSEAKIIKGLFVSCDAEALRLVNMLPNWNPASQDGVACKTKMIIPIKFEL